MSGKALHTIRRQAEFGGAGHPCVGSLNPAVHRIQLRSPTVSPWNLKESSTQHRAKDRAEAQGTRPPGQASHSQSWPVDSRQVLFPGTKGVSSDCELLTSCLRRLGVLIEMLLGPGPSSSLEVKVL